MRYLSLPLFICLLLSQLAWGQQRPVFSQYMFNGLAINPAYAGNQNQFSATFLMRNQWVNLEGAPKTQTLSAHTSFDKKRIGVGLQVYHETIGVHRDLGLYTSYAYWIKLGKGKLAFGLQGGFNQLLSDFRSLNQRDQGDPLLDNVRNFNPNFGAGTFYSTKNFYFGFSVPYLVNNRLQGSLENAVSSEGREARYYFLNTGYVFDISRRLKVKPSVLLRMQEGAPLGTDLNVNLFLDDIINVGASWRSGDSIIMLFELHLNENFSFAYAYDMVTSSLSKYSRGSHELMVNYRIKLSPQPCHSYF